MISIKNVLRKLSTPTTLPHMWADITIAIPRIVSGAILAGFGSDKFGMPWTSTDSNLQLLEVAAWFPADVAEFGGIFAIFPWFFAWMGAASEAIGGILLMLGLQTRIASFFILITMLVAIFFQKWTGPLWEMLPAMGFLWVAIYHLVLGSSKVGIDFILTNKSK